MTWPNRGPTWHQLVLYDSLVGPRLPDGLPGVRDIDNPCETFDPTPIDRGHPYGGHCKTDGHYICAECNRLDLTSDYASRRGMNPMAEDNYDD